jgi:GNAT superfamily N-acetyltransferase
VTPDGLTIRPARADDVGRLVALLALGAVEASPSVAADLAAYAAALHDIDAGPGALLVADLRGEAIGVCQLIVFRHLQHGGGLCAEVESVHVHPDHRGRGIGHDLMRAAIERARQLGCYGIQLTSNAVRTDAHRFYQSLGFTPSHVGFKLVLA